MNEELMTGLKIRKILDESTSRLPQQIQSRLEVAIALSVTHHKEIQPVKKQTPKALLHCIWTRITLTEVLTSPAFSLAVSSFFIAVAGFGVIKNHESVQHAEVVAMSELDAAILTDDLPPDAWLDPGFVSYSTDIQRSPSQIEENMQNWLEKVAEDQPST